MADFWNTIIKISNAFNDMFRTQDMAAYIINNWGNVAGYVLAGLCIVLGVILALIGARALKVSAILLSLWLGIIIGRGVLYPIVEAHSTLTAEWQTALKWILPAVLSIILIFATYKVAKVACFVCGGLCGFYVAHGLAATVMADTVVTLIFCALGILLFGLTAMLIRKFILRLCFAILGAFLAAFGIAMIPVLIGQPGFYAVTLLIGFVVSIVMITVIMLLSKNKKHQVATQ